MAPMATICEGHGGVWRRPESGSSALVAEIGVLDVHFLKLFPL
jgi:hypothetical protein